MATVVFCGAVLALGAVSTRSLSQTKLNRQYETAASLADRQLTLIDYMGIEDFIEQGETEGVSEGPDQSYYWRVTVGTMVIDSLYEVNMTVVWDDRNRTHSVSVVTRLNGTGQLIEVAPE